MSPFQKARPEQAKRARSVGEVKTRPVTTLQQSENASLLEAHRDPRPRVALYSLPSPPRGNSDRSRVGWDLIEVAQHAAAGAAYGAV